MEPVGRRESLDVETKWCNGCKTDLSVDVFGKRSSAPDGLHPRCKACCKIDREGYKQYQKDYQAREDVRGLLCWQCNSAIGLLKEDVARLRNLITYLEGGGYGSASKS